MNNIEKLNEQCSELECLWQALDQQRMNQEGKGVNALDLMFVLKAEPGAWEYFQPAYHEMVIDTIDPKYIHTFDITNEGEVTS